MPSRAAWKKAAKQWRRRDAMTRDRYERLQRALQRAGIIVGLNASVSLRLAGRTNDADDFAARAPGSKAAIPSPDAGGAE